MPAHATREARTDITCIIGASPNSADEGRLTVEHGSGAAYGDWIVAHLVQARCVAGVGSDRTATVVSCARVALRLVLDDLIAMCDAGRDGPDRVLLCDAALWLETLGAAPEAWRAGS